MSIETVILKGDQQNELHSNHYYCNYLPDHWMDLLDREKDKMNNDLISREALKKTLCEEYEAREHYIGEIMLKAIDNAPTVSDRYEEGYSQGYIDGSTGADWKGGAENDE